MSVWDVFVTCDKHGVHSKCGRGGHLRVSQSQRRGAEVDQQLLHIRQRCGSRLLAGGERDVRRLQAISERDIVHSQSGEAVAVGSQRHGGKVGRRGRQGACQKYAEDGNNIATAADANDMGGLANEAVVDGRAQQRRRHDCEQQQEQEGR